MKKLYQKTVFLCCIVIILFTVSFPSKAEVIHKWKYNDFIYERYTADEVKITNYVGNLSKVTIPKEIRGKRVTRVINFKKAKNLKTIVITKNVRACKLAAAPALKTIRVKKNNPYFTVANKFLVSKDLKVLYTYPGGYKKIDDIPSSIKEIHEDAFRDSKLERIVLGKNVIKIGQNSFKDCKKLKEVTLNKRLKSIETQAFYGCSNLRSINLGKNVEKIEEFAFLGSGLRKIVIRNPNCKIIEQYTFPETAVIYGYKGSTAQKYARRYKIKFVAL